MVKFLIINGVQEGRVLHLKPGVNRIGRGVENHFQIPDPSVSSSHCEVVFADASILVRDLNSTNGTFVDGEPIQEANIRIGQKLQLGNVELSIERPMPAQSGPNVNVPDLSLARPVVSSMLSDGSLACANHPEVAGAYQCTKCQQALCGACVRIIRRVAGGTMVFCSLCAGPCESLAPPPQALAVAARSKRRFFGRLTQTLKLPFGRHKADQHTPPAE